MKEIRSSLNLGLDLRQSRAAILLKSLRQLSPWPTPPSSGGAFIPSL
jgi:hypothetical protein